MTYDIHQAAVQRGATFLDSHPAVPPSWRGLIDVERLDVSNGFDCPVGQISGRITGDDDDGQDYWGAIEILAPDHYRAAFSSNVRTWEIEHGFFAGDSASYVAGAGSMGLTAAWKTYLSSGTE